MDDNNEVVRYVSSKNELACQEKMLMVAISAVHRQ